MSLKSKTTKLFGMGFPIILLGFFMIALAHIFLGTEAGYFLQWYGMLFILGVAFFPLSMMLFSTFDNKGYLFAKTIGIAITGFAMWMLSSFHLLKFTRLNSIIVVVALFIIEMLLFFVLGKKKKINFFKPFLERKEYYLRQILFIEMLFFIVFLFFLYLKGFKPEVNGTEKFMDYGFMTSIMRSDYMPPNDFWFSGQPLNYYYLGQYFTTFLTKLSGNTVAYGYNLALMMIASFCFCFSFEIGKELFRMVQTKKEDIRKKQRRITVFAGFLTAFAVTLAGNMHYVLFYKLIPWLQQMLEIEGKAYWFPDSTRFIGYRPETADKTIHEFPSYSFILGDLHAHVIDIMFVLTFLAVLLAFVASRKKRMEQARIGELQVLESGKEMFSIHVIFLGFFLGIFQMTNFWDYPIYFTVAILTIVFCNLIQTGFKKNWIGSTFWQIFILYVISQLTSFLFQMQFKAMVNGIGICKNHTPIYQLVILWGLPAFTVIGFLIYQYNKSKKSKVKVHKNKLFALLGGMETADLFALILGLCAIGLVFIPEVIYVKDIYEGDYDRSNTMFKLVYQAFILFGISMSYIITHLIFQPEGPKHKKRGIIALILVLLTCGYFVTASHMWFGELTNDRRIGLDGTLFAAVELQDDIGGIDWLNENIKDPVVVLESNGESYTLYERVSVLTGLPTLLGWYTHEWLWQNTTDFINKRADDILSIYTSTDLGLVKDLIDQYGVSYIFIGQMEYTRFEAINVEGICSLGEIVYTQKDTVSGKPTIIVKVAP